jgi:hypothetical protein
MKKDIGHGNFIGWMASGGFFKTIDYYGFAGGYWMYISGPF